MDLDYFDFGEKLHLYRDGVEVEVQKSPATFELGPGASIEASMGLLGMRQVERERPELSRRIGTASWAVLVVALVYEVMQLIGLAADALGSDFEPPVTLPGTANLLLGLVALAAAVERALRFKTNRWLG